MLSEDYKSRFEEMSDAELSKFIADIDEAYNICYRRHIPAGREVLSQVSHKAHKVRIRRSNDGDS